MTAIMLMLVLAVTVEALVQYSKTVIYMVAARDYKTAITQLGALLASVALCVLAGADIYAALGVSFGAAGGSPIGAVLTGAFASRGANYAADMVKALQGAAKD